MFDIIKGDHICQKLMKNRSDSATVFEYNRTHHPLGIRVARLWAISFSSFFFLHTFAHNVLLIERPTKATVCLTEWSFAEPFMTNLFITVLKYLKALVASAVSPGKSRHAAWTLWIRRCLFLQTWKKDNDHTSAHRILQPQPNLFLS